MLLPKELTTREAVEDSSGDTDESTTEKTTVE